MSTLVIANPIAGRGRARAGLPRLERLLAAALGEYDLRLTEAPGHAEELARKAASAGFTQVIAVGGDGTVGEVLNGLAGTETALGIVPVGTGNDLARGVGIPRAPEAAAAGLARAVRRRIDLGEEGGRLFGVIVGVGFAAEAMRQANLRRGPAQGSAAILFSIVQTVAKLEPVPVRLFLDDREPVEAPMEALFVLNTRTTGGGLMICPEATPDDGLLDICLMGDISRLDFLVTLPKAYQGRHVGHPKVSFYRAKSVRLEADRPLIKMFDGDLYGDAPLDALIRPAALDVLVPVGRPQAGGPAPSRAPR
jgi:diacylglycerol kinase (ATP)